MFLRLYFCDRLRTLASRVWQGQEVECPIQCYRFLIFRKRNTQEQTLYISYSLIIRQNMKVSALSSTKFPPAREIR